MFHRVRRVRFRRPTALQGHSLRGHGELTTVDCRIAGAPPAELIARCGRSLGYCHLCAILIACLRRQTAGSGRHCSLVLVLYIIAVQLVVQL